MDVNIKEAKTKMGALLDLSQNGEKVFIVRRGKMIARLVGGNCFGGLKTVR